MEKFQKKLAQIENLTYQGKFKLQKLELDAIDASNIKSENPKEELPYMNNLMMWLLKQFGSLEGTDYLVSQQNEEL